MSRATDFDDMYAGSRDRLLLELYAYGGDADAAQDALSEAFISASRHWHRLAALGTLDPWLRERGVRRLDRRPHPGSPGTAVRESDPARPGAQPSAENRRLLAALASLDRTSRRLLIVRRLDDTDLPSAAREVGLTDAGAEQALARASSTLHGSGIDATPAGLQARLTRLADDLAGRDQPPARTLRRMGAHRRYAATTVLGLALVVVAAAAGAVSASHPLGNPSGIGEGHPPRSTPSGGSVPAPNLGAGQLLTAGQVSAVGGARWNRLPAVPRVATSTVYGGCVEAADDPPPDTSWVRSFAPAARGSATQVREVLQQAPSPVEAQRAFRRVVTAFGVCPGHHLVGFSAVRRLGERARLIHLRLPTRGGSTGQTVVIATSGAAVTVVYEESAPGTAAGFTSLELAQLGGMAVNDVCPRSGGKCASPPYPIRSLPPPHGGTPHGFLSVLDLPLVPGVTSPWKGTRPELVRDNPSATACDGTDFAGAGARSVTSRRYVIPPEARLPTAFAVTETIGRFKRPVLAKQFLMGVAAQVSACHHRQPTLSVTRSGSFSSDRMSGRVWQVQQTTKKRVTTVWMALVRNRGETAEVTFTPAGAYDGSQAAFTRLAERAAARLGG
ncbi:MAG: hypothetical protein QOI06_784 [Nocardioidaceae bacterium]|nr:hypothetical protein [Nocardioidaceae bacterium]